MTDLFPDVGNMPAGSAIFSGDRRYRLRLDCRVGPSGPVILFVGVNPSKADGVTHDPTTRVWKSIAADAGASRYIAVNPFALIATDVSDLGRTDDPVGPGNDAYIANAIAEADILVPCWGSRAKVPHWLRPAFVDLASVMFASGKPVKTIGLTKEGDPRHPLRTKLSGGLVPWAGYR